MSTLYATIPAEKLDSDGEVIEEFLIFVEAEYTPEERGSRGHYGEQMEPDCPSKIEIISSTLRDGEEHELSEDEERVAMYELWSQVEE